MKALLKRLLNRFGYVVTRVPAPPPAPRGVRQRDIDLYREVRCYTMTSLEAVTALADAVRYVISNGIGGAIVECGA